MYVRFGNKIDKELDITENFFERISKNNDIKNKIINGIGSRYVYDSELHKIKVKYETVKNKIQYFKSI